MTIKNLNKQNGLLFSHYEIGSTILIPILRMFYTRLGCESVSTCQSCQEYHTNSVF